MKTKYTPSPWVYSTYGFQVLTGDSWNSICELKPCPKFKNEKVNQDYEWERQLANAKLIAAAPSLLEAILKAMQIVELWTYSSDIEKEHEVEAKCLNEMKITFEKVIKKATE